MLKSSLFKFLSLFLLFSISLNANASGSWNSTGLISDPNADMHRKNGDILQFVPSVMALGIIAYKKDLEGLKQFGYTLGVTALAVGGLKALQLESRPTQRGDHTTWKFGNGTSFPSGHAAGGFVATGFLAKRYGIAYAIAPTLVGAYVGYSRVVAEKHYITDVVASFAIATAAGWFLTTEYEVGKDKRGGKDSGVAKIMFSPSTTAFGGVGGNLRIAF
jgi:membrane-associated phospholipid phosphatase